MPKERFHLLVADQILPGLCSLRRSSAVTTRQRLAYHLGAISPDTLFYDLPSFHFSPAAKAFHRLEGPPVIDFLGSLIDQNRPQVTPESGMWLLGVASHLLADGFWHPVVEKMTAFDGVGSLAVRFKLSKREAHHWLESELEGFWMDRIGPAGGYRQMLKDFAAPSEIRAACIRCLRMILRRLGVVDLPDAERIGRCFSWQAFLLRQCAQPGWARWRKLLLRFPATRFWGTLIVPKTADRSTFLACLAQTAGACRDSGEKLFSDHLMARSLTFLTTHLPSLAAQL